MVNETVVENCKFRRIVNPFHQRWEVDAANVEYIEWKIKHNLMVKKMLRRKPEIIGRKQVNIMDDFMMTRTYQNFNGRIITDELILYKDQEIPIKAEWDTGATYSCISDKLVEKLGLIPIKTVFLDTSGGQVESKVYTIDLVLNNDLQISIDVNSVSGLDQKEIQCLIGMDIITFGDFAISTYKGQTCFSFRIPSKGLIDFTKE